MADTCKSCKWFHEPYVDHNTHSGLCRRFPPIFDRVWPKVSRYEWCGEFGKREGQPND